MEASRTNPDWHVHWKTNPETNAKEVGEINSKPPGLMTQ